MPVAQVLVLLLLIGSHGMAQNAPYDEDKPTAEYAPISVQPISLPATPQPQTVIDKKFIAIMGTLGLAESMRFTTTTLVMEHAEAAGAPWAMNRPSNPHVIARDAALYVGEVLVAYEIKKPHAWLPGDRIIRKFWWAYPAAMAGIHFKSAIRTIRLKPPVGCTADGCP